MAIPGRNTVHWGRGLIVRFSLSLSVRACTWDQRMWGRRQLFYVPAVPLISFWKDLTFRLASLTLLTVVSDQCFSMVCRPGDHLRV